MKQSEYGHYCSYSSATSAPSSAPWDFSKLRVGIAQIPRFLVKMTDRISVNVTEVENLDPVSKISSFVRKEDSQEEKPKVKECLHNI